MGKQIKQIRYYSEGDSRNNPENLSLFQLVEGSAFGNYMPVTRLSIQTTPGIKFYLNNGLNPVIIGFTGIYELDINNLAEITSLRFDHTTVSSLNESKDTYLFVDMVYDEEEE